MNELIKALEEKLSEIIQKMKTLQDKDYRSISFSIHMEDRLEYFKLQGEQHGLETAIAYAKSQMHKEEKARLIQQIEEVEKLEPTMSCEAYVIRTGVRSFKYGSGFHDYQLTKNIASANIYGERKFAESDLTVPLYAKNNAKVIKIKIQEVLDNEN